MLTQEEDVEIHALGKRGWSIAAIARHTGRNRKTIRAYLAGERQVGVRLGAEADPFDRIESYVAQRLSDDHGVWATVLFDEVKVLGYDRSYPTFTRKLRQRRLRPHCEACAASNGRAHVDIEHPPVSRSGWDWLEFPETPWGDKAFVLVGVLSHSARFRAWITDSDDQPHLIEGVDAVLRRLGGTAQVNTLAEAQASLGQFCATISDARRRGDSTVGDLAAAEPLLELPAVAYPVEGTMTRTVAPNDLPPVSRTVLVCCSCHCCFSGVAVLVVDW